MPSEPKLLIPAAREQRHNTALQSLDSRGTRAFSWLMASLIMVFAADLWAPKDLAIPICYVATMVLVVALPGRREKVLLAVVCTILLALDFFFSQRSSSAPVWSLIVNQTLAVGMIWGVTVLGLRHRRVTEAML